MLKKIYPAYVSKDNANHEKQIKEEIIKNVSYILQFIDSSRFMPILLPSLINNFSEGIHRTKCKLGHGGSNIESPDCVKHIESNITIFFLEYTNFKDNLIESKYLCCNKSFQRKFEEKLK